MKWFSIVVASMFLLMAIPAISGENQASNEDVVPAEMEHAEMNDEKLNLEDAPELKGMEDAESEEMSDDEGFDMQREMEMLAAENKKTDEEIEKINKQLENQEKEVAAAEESINKEINGEDSDENNLPYEQVAKENQVSDQSEINTEKEQDTETPEEK